MKVSSEEAHDVVLPDEVHPEEDDARGVDLQLQGVRGAHHPRGPAAEQLVDRVPARPRKTQVLGDQLVLQRARRRC